MQCRISKDQTKELFSLGNLYISDFIPMEAKSEDYQDQVPLTIVSSSKSGLIQLKDTPDPEKMYRRYWYSSGTNRTMTKELQSIVQAVTDRIKVSSEDAWLDIGSNDGTLLKFVNTNFRIGFDPSPDNCKKAREFTSIAEVRPAMIVNDYFNKESYPKVKKAKIITAIAMFYDLPDPNKFCRDVYDVMDDEGVWVIQMSYLPLMIEQMAFDNICHEHLEYYDLRVIKNLLETNGFVIRDVELNDTNGGSFRVYAQKSISDETKFGTSPYRDVANFRIRSIISEENANYNDMESKLLKFYDDLLKLKQEVTSFIKEEVSKGKTIWAYGASTKGNTLLQYFGLDNTYIKGISERQERKWGLKTIGSEIPIFSEEEARKANPDYMLVLPWHFIKEFRERENDYLQSGGKFIIPCPKFEIIGK
jgi:hypothetical protein